ncbi:hypothetical protein [Candidatus Cyrtobacter comes]|uniref:hypothetical protein n=1 Tax=Candidatus Cyrtobacter comes TaxID=675776 RepID=UPI002ACDB830|nr:hypothetical protein [Candidatus Cyrtobacter comes]
MKIRKNENDIKENLSKHTAPQVANQWVSKVSPKSAEHHDKSHVERLNGERGGQEQSGYKR